MLCPAARLAGSLGVTKGEPTEPLKSLIALAEPRNKQCVKISDDMILSKQYL